MEFQLQSAVYKQSDQDNQKRFKDSYDPAKKYPHVRGQIAIRVDELESFAKYLRESASLQDLKPQKFAYYNKATKETVIEEHLAILLDVSGYTGKTKTDPPTQMISLKIDPHWLMKRMIEEQALQSSSSVDDAAANLAKGTAGAVVEPSEDSIW